MILAIDFDGCITRQLPYGAPPVLRDGAADALRAMAAAGHTMILHSVRFGAEGSDGLATEAELFLRREGLWTLFGRVWREPGKPYADLYIDDRCQRIGDLGRALDGSVNWGMLAFWYGGAIANPTPAWAGEGDPPRLMIWRRVGEITFWLVDGPWIRGHREYDQANHRIGETEAYDCTDFTDGGNGGRYPWIPLDEVWIDSAVSREEIPFMAVHEAVERYWMMEGKSYTDAHQIASRIEARLRSDPSDIDREIEKACGVARLVAGEP